MEIYEAQWYEFPGMSPGIGSMVLVRVACNDGKVVFFEDYLGPLGKWQKALDGQVTHWVRLPKIVCPTCGKS